VLCVLALLVLVVAPQSPAWAANANEEPVLQPQMATTTAMRTYWTEERMRSAKPLPMPQLLGLPPEPVASLQALPSGPALIADSGGPGDLPTERILDQAELLQPDTGALANPGSFAFTRYRLFPNVRILYQQFPYLFVGKVFFTIPGRGDFVCSGSVVNAPNLSLVWTAGHCVHTQGIGFHTNFVFVPARHEGVNPFALWTANTLGAPAGWVNAGLFEYDHGAAFMNPGGPGAGGFLIGQGGFLGFAANLPRQQHWHLQGYPAALPFDGEHHEICATDWSTDDQPTGVPGADPQTIGVGCDLTGGASGGPWTLDLNGEPGSGNLVNGNVSYRYFDTPDRMYGPYFGNAAIALRDALGNM